MSILNNLFNRKKDSISLNLSDDLLKQLKEDLDDMTPLNILLLGKTGSGKSTLVNSLFRENLAETGVGLPVTQGINKISKEGVPLTIYDTQGLELDFTSQEEVLEKLIKLLKDKKAQGIAEEIHLIYYCIPAVTNRIEKYEVDLIKVLSKEAPVMLVVTFSIGDYQPFVDELVKLDLPVEGIYSVLAKPFLVNGENYIPSFGMQELLDASLSLVPEEVSKAFINAQQVDIDLKVEEARSWAKKYVLGAFGVGFVPIPIADASILIPMQITMLAHVTAVFGLSLDRAQLLSIIAGIGGTGATTTLGKYLSSSLFKLIPGAGKLAGSTINALTAASLTLALSYSYIEVLKQIALAEKEGRTLPLDRIQKIMNSSLSEQLSFVEEFLPKKVKSSDIYNTLKTYIEDVDKNS